MGKSLRRSCVAEFGTRAAKGGMNSPGAELGDTRAITSEDRCELPHTSPQEILKLVSPLMHVMSR
jgi:hypothetical protein